jgi:hypothetical protein
VLFVLPFHSFIILALFFATSTLALRVKWRPELVRAVQVNLSSLILRGTPAYFLARCDRGLRPGSSMYKNFEGGAKGGVFVWVHFKYRQCSATILGDHLLHL